MANITTKKGKKVMIVETIRTKPIQRIDEQATTNGKPVYKFKALCAEFGKSNLNENDRWYDKDDYLQHISYLKEEIQGLELAGELDHSEEYLPSMKALSHLITDIYYDETEDAVYIEFELLDTDDGKRAMVYADRGMPLFVSSRASGYIDDDGKVTLERIYTYDIVYKPGFRRAKSERLNESLNIKSNNIDVYDYDEFMKNKIYNQNKSRNMDNQQFVTKDAFDKFTNSMKAQLKDVESLLKKIPTAGKVNEGMNVPKTIKMNGIEMESINQIPEEGDTIEADGMDYGVTEVTSIDDLSEEDDGHKFKGTYKYELGLTDDHGNLIKGYISSTGELHLIKDEEETDTGSVEALENYLVQTSGKVNEIIEAFNSHKKEFNALLKYLDVFKQTFEGHVQSTHRMTQFINKLADHQDATTNFVNKLADADDEKTKVVNKLVEHADKTTAFVNGLADHSDDSSAVINAMIKHLDTVSKFTNKLADHQDATTKFINERVGDKVVSSVESERLESGNLLSKVDNILESVRTNKAEENRKVFESQFPFVKNLSDEDKVIFSSFGAHSKKALLAKIKEGVEPSKAIHEVKSEESTLEFLDSMPAEYEKIWESLSSERKNDIIALFRLKGIKSDAEIELFWENLDLRKFKPSRVDEQAHNPAFDSGNGTVSSLGYTEEDIDGLLNI